MRIILGALLAVAGLAGRAAAQSSSDCVAFAGKGCYFPGSGPLLIYIRGHLNGSGHITGAANILASSRQAFDYYALGKTAQSKGLALLITGSSDISVTQSDIKSLEKQAGRTFDKIYIAAHSGAYVGLPPSLDSLARVDKILLLDCFYGSTNLQALASKVAKLEGSGTTCDGYLTPHNRNRFETYFKGTRCAIEKRPSDGEHNTRVNACLGSYVDGPTCAAATLLEDRPLDQILGGYARPQKGPVPSGLDLEPARKAILERARGVDWYR